MKNIESFRNAMNVLQGIIRKTNLIYSKTFSESTGNNIYLKPENMQVTGSYKIRGAYYKLSTLSNEKKKKGLITSSAGNHAQGVAYASSLMNIDSTIVMPTTTPLVKVNNTKKYGANIILHGGFFDESYTFASNLALEKDFTFIHPFNDLDIATGQGTIGYEILKDLPDADIILIPIGGGGLSSGVSTLVKMLNPHVKVIGVEPVGAACMKASLDNKKVTTLDKVDTIADGVAVQTPGDIVFPFIQKNLDEIILIEDHELIDAFLDVSENHKMIVENAGLLTIAALKKIPAKKLNVVSILSGGNMDVITMSSIIQHGLINRERIFTFSVLLPDRPGELTLITQSISKKRGNIIKLEHNQFVSINRNSAVELIVTLETFGHEHKCEILQSLVDDGYCPTIVSPKSFY